MKLNYTRTGDYLIPNLVIDEPDEVPGKYGMLRKSYLKNHRGGTYQTMLMTGKLTQHLLEIDRAANHRMEVIVAQLLEKNPAPSKEADQLKWAAHMTFLQNQAEEIVLTELVYR